MSKLLGSILVMAGVLFSSASMAVQQGLDSALDLSEDSPGVIATLDSEYGHMVIAVEGSEDAPAQSLAAVPAGTQLRLVNTSNPNVSHVMTVKKDTSIADLKTMAKYGHWDTAAVNRKNLEVYVSPEGRTFLRAVTTQ